MSETCPNKCTLEYPVLVEIQGVYDGALFFHCEVCKLSWHRWPEGHYLHEKAKRFIFAWNLRNGHIKGE